MFTYTMTTAKYSYYIDYLECRIRIWSGKFGFTA